MSAFPKLQYFKKAELMGLAESLDLKVEGTKSDLEERITETLLRRRRELENMDDYSFLYTSSPRKRMVRKTDEAGTPSKRAPPPPTQFTPDVKVKGAIEEQEQEEEEEEEEDDEEYDENEEAEESGQDDVDTKTLAEHWAQWKDTVGGHLQDLFDELVFQFEETVSIIRYQLSTLESATLFSLCLELYYLFVHLIPFQLGLRWGRFPTRVGHSLVEHLEGKPNVIKAGWFDLNDWFPIHVVQTPDFSVLLKCKTWTTILFWAVGAVVIPATVAYFVNFTAASSKKRRGSSVAKTHNAVVYLQEIDPFVFNLIRVINYYILTRGVLTVFPFLSSWTAGLLRANRQAILLNGAFGDLPLFSGAALVLLAIYVHH